MEKEQDIPGSLLSCWGNRVRVVVGRTLFCITLIARMVVGWGSLQGVDKIRYIFRWAMDHSTTYQVMLIPLLNRFCHSSRGFQVFFWMVCAS